MKGLVTVCSECGAATELREISIEFERKGVRAVMVGIPAMVCPQCGEEYVPGEIADDVIEAVSCTIDGTAALLKRTQERRLQLAPQHKHHVSRRLELALTAR